MSKPSEELQKAIAEMESHILPSGRRSLEVEFHEWAKNTGARVGFPKMAAKLDEVLDKD